MKILICMSWWNALDKAFGGWVWSKFHYSSLCSSWWNIDQTQPHYALSRALHRGIQFNILSLFSVSVPILAAPWATHRQYWWCRGDRIQGLVSWTWNGWNTYRIHQTNDGLGWLWVECLEFSLPSRNCSLCTDDQSAARSGQYQGWRRTHWCKALLL